MNIRGHILMKMTMSRTIKGRTTQKWHGKCSTKMILLLPTARSSFTVGPHRQCKSHEKLPQNLSSRPWNFKKMDGPTISRNGSTGLTLQPTNYGMRYGKRGIIRVKLRTC